jgi:hypothetical protein
MQKMPAPLRFIPPIFLSAVTFPADMAWKNLLSAKSATATSILSHLLRTDLSCQRDRKFFDAIKGREIEKCPFMNLPEKKGPHRMDREKMATVRWLRLRIVAEIAFNERTNAGHPRHSKFFACGIVQMYAQKRGQTRNKATTL